MPAPPARMPAVQQARAPKTAGAPLRPANRKKPPAAKAAITVLTRIAASPAPGRLRRHLAPWQSNVRVY